MSSVMSAGSAPFDERVARRRREEAIICLTRGPHVAHHFASNGQGGDIVITAGHAQISLAVPRA